MSDLKKSPTGLFVGWYVKVAGTHHPRSGEGWCIMARSAAANGNGIIGGPYASKRDAQIGLEAFANCGIDWSQPMDSIREQVRQRGGVEFLDRVAYECLPW